MVVCWLPWEVPDFVNAPDDGTDEANVVTAVVFEGSWRILGEGGTEVIFEMADGPL